MIIYRILNKKTGKSYIGQTKFNTIKERYWGEWYKSTHSQLLKNSVKKHGSKNFSIEILNENIRSLKQLDKLEKQYITQYNTLYPNGYNFMNGGNSNHTLHQKTKDKIRKKLEREFYLKDWLGNEYHVIGLKHFCETRKLKYQPMKNMVQGQTYSSQGFGLKQTDITLIKNPNIQHKIYNIITKKHAIFSNIRQFCREQNLNHEKLQRLLSGHRKSPYCNWIIDGLDLSKWKKSNEFKEKKLISPDGIVYELNETPYSFAKKHPPLDRKDVYMLIKGQTKERKGGWMLYII